MPIYKHYANKNRTANVRNPRMDLQEWLTFVKDAALLSEQITRQEVVLAFVWSRMRVADEIAESSEFQGLTVIDFYEALARIADMMSLPTPDDLAAAGTKRLSCYFEFLHETEDDQLRQRLLRRRDSASGLLQPKTQPLAHKVDLCCEYVLVHLAIHFKGTLPAGNGYISFDLQKLLTPEQREKYIAQACSPAPLAMPSYHTGRADVGGGAVPAECR